MLKENKKLSAKVESLTRKIQTLQSKVTTLKANSPKPDSKVASTSKPSSSSLAPIARARSGTVAAVQQPVEVQRSSMPPTSRSSTLSRVDSVPSRTKAPESRAPSQVLRSKTPDIPRASTSPVGETESVAGKKRRAPDDFEVCDSMPPQAFTAESVPKAITENRTPRTRRVLSTLQSSFTPVRTNLAARQVAPLPSPRRNPLPTSTQSPFMAENSPMNAVPPLAFAPPSAGKSSNKRSWLGKIRGAGTGPGMSRPQ